MQNEYQQLQSDPMCILNNDVYDFNFGFFAYSDRKESEGFSPSSAS